MSQVGRSSVALELPTVFVSFTARIYVLLTNYTGWHGTRCCQQFTTCAKSLSNEFLLHGSWTQSIVRIRSLYVSVG